MTTCASSHDYNLHVSNSAHRTFPGARTSSASLPRARREIRPLDEFLDPARPPAMITTFMSPTLPTRPCVVRASAGLLRGISCGHAAFQPVAT
ncbi:MAG: hypothetical protein ACRER9_04195, partial [Gammaproteobacteria bacterium]